MRRIAALVLVLLVFPAGAHAGWRPTEPGGGAKPSGDAVVEGGAASSPLTVRVRGDTPVTVPGSEGGRDAVAALGPRGLVVVAWADVRCTTSEEVAAKGSCESAILASTWRRGSPPPPPARLSGDDITYPDRPAAGIAPDGTVLVVWNVLDDDYIGVPVEVHAAVARGTGPFAVSTLAAELHAGVAVVRGAAQVALLTETGRDTAVALADARAGALGGPRADALARGASAIDLQLLRSRRGDRLLVWDTDSGVAILHGASGRPVGPRAMRLRSDTGGDAVATLSERGEFALLLNRAGPAGFERVLAVRGRTGRRTVRRQGLVPASYTGFGSSAGAVVIDRAGRTIVVWDRALRPPRGRRASWEIYGAAATRGGRFGRGRRLSTLRRPGFCSSPSLVARSAGGALARWRCDPSGRARAFRRHTVLRPGD